MGCDIHGYVEYSYRYEEWTGIAFESIPRNYFLFEALAGIMGKKKPLIPPKGIPLTASSIVKNYYLADVVDDVDDCDEGIERREAEEYIQKGFSHYWHNDNTLISRPDWHTPSWLTLKEINQVLQHAQIEKESLARQFLIVIDLMEAIERWDRIGKNTSRFVFWFDN